MDTNEKKGFTYIEITEFEAAQAALGIHAFNGILLKVKLYTARVVKIQKTRHKTIEEVIRKRLYQAPDGMSHGLNNDIKYQHLQTHLNEYGTVTGIAQHKLVSDTF